MSALSFLQIRLYITLVKNVVILMKSIFSHFFLKSARKWNFKKKKKKKKLIRSMFNRWGMLMHITLLKFTFRIRQENTNFIASFPGKTMFKLKKYSKILPKFSKFGVNSPEWLVGLLFRLVYNQAVTQKNEERKEK